MKIIKRDGRIVEYNRQKVENAIMHANNDVTENNRVNKKQIDNIIKHIEELNKKRMLVEDIQDMIETELMKIKKYDLAKAYIIYRYKRALVRKSNITDESILSLIKNNNYENDNKKNRNLVSIQRDLIASEVSKDLTKRVLLPEKISEAHKNGTLYFHDEEFFLQPLINSCLVNYQDILENDIIINNTKLDKPTDFIEACNILSQVIFNVSISQYGGQSIDIKHLSKYLKMAVDKYKLNKKDEQNLIQNQLKNGIEIIMYQINSLSLIREKNPVITLFLSMGDDEYNTYTELIINEFLNKYKKIFKDKDTLPNVVYLLTEDNVVPKSKYYYLTEKVIDIINSNLPIILLSSKIMKKNYDNIFSPMDCCHLLSPFKDKNKFKYSGRFNQGIVTINLPQIGIESNGNEEIFWNLLEERLDLCFEALMCRYHALLGTLSNTSPIHFQNGVIQRLNSEEKIDSLLKNSYSTLSLGYIGLNELTILMKKESLLEKNGEKFALKTLKYIRTKCDLWKKETGLGFILYGIPDNNLGEYLKNIDKEKYGIIKNITDKDAYSISHNVNDIKTNIYESIKQLKEYQNICSGGDITYLNIDNNNINETIELIYENLQITQIKINKGV